MTTGSFPVVDAMAAGPDFDDAGLEWVVLATPDINGALRGKLLSSATFASIVDAGAVAITDLIFATDATDTPIETSVGVGPRTGGRDLLLCPDLATITTVPWRPSWAWCLGSPVWRDGGPCEVSPRVVCASAIEALERVGLATTAAFEYEFRLYRNRGGEPATSGMSYSLDQLRGLAGFIDDLGRIARDCGLNVSAFHTEAAPGLMEVNLSPTSGVHAADQAILLRACIAEVAYRHDMRASFVAKAVVGEEGSGGHLHLSLLDDDGNNVFAGNVLRGDPPSAHLGHAIAGLLRHMPALSVIYNPHVNSYKRLVPGWFAPVDASWAVDDRAAAVRVAAGNTPADTHVELRRAGSDANPYLVLAAATTSILSGVEHRLTLAPSGSTCPLPGDLRGALQAFERDTSIQRLLGDVFSQHYATTREWELSAWKQVVTDWETTRAEGMIEGPFMPAG